MHMPHRALVAAAAVHMSYMDTLVRVHVRVRVRDCRCMPHNHMLFHGPHHYFPQG